MEDRQNTIVQLK